MKTRPFQLACKSLLDRVLAAATLVALSPLLAAVALAIKLGDGGPVCFRQQRVGRGESRFSVWKFRTMIVDADRLLAADGGTGGVNRVTPVGKLLRKFSLDELPQLINIARGEMSLFGPRPILPERAARLDTRQRGRFAMRPGLSGLAQVNGRNTLKWSQRIEYDLQYVEQFTLWLDLKILVRTLGVVLGQQGVVLDRNPGDVDDLPPAPVESELTDTAQSPSRAA